MKVQIRNCVFETNSSSTHSLSINTDSSIFKLDESLKVNDDNNIVLLGGEFGWDICEYDDAQSKASYLAIYALDYGRDNTESFIDILKDVIKNETGCNSVLFNFGDDSFIDHQSADDNDLDYLFADTELLRNFIFDSNSKLYTDNDNHE